MHVLQIAPMPTHPATQGNRRRALDMCRAFQRQGASVTYLYWAAEGADPTWLAAMRQSWDELVVVPPDGFREKRSHQPHYALDDWYDPRIGAAVREIARRHPIDVCITNYVWTSGALESVARDCVRIIDTHDVFGGRAESFYKIGLQPEWYYTGVYEEGRGLDRADIVLAIQDQEQLQLQARTRAEVLTVGFMTRRVPTIRQPSVEKLTAGYLASDNPLNVMSILAFASALEALGLDGVRLVAAGPICRVLRDIPDQPFELMGIVDDLTDFYGSIDVSINPMVGGTGLKIKTIEALAHDVAVIGTTDAFAGIASEESLHQAKDPQEVAAFLHALAAEPERVEALTAVSRAVFDRYSQTQYAAFDDLHDRIERLRARRLLQATA